MEHKEQIISDFTIHIKQLVARCRLQQEKIELMKAELKKSKDRCDELELLLSCAESDYYNLKTAKMLQVGDGDIEAAKQRISKLIRDVNKCITLLNKSEELD